MTYLSLEAAGRFALHPAAKGRDASVPWAGAGAARCVAGLDLGDKSGLCDEKSRPAYSKRANAVAPGV